MGWTYYHALNYLPNGRVDRKAECDRELTWENDTKQDRVLKSSMVGSTYYAAVERKNLQTGERRVWAAIFLTHTDSKDYYNFGYKDMDETMHPFFYQCPKSILALLSETDNQSSNEWRDRCHAYHAEQKRLRQGNKAVFKFPFDVSWNSYQIPAGEEVTLSRTRYAPGRAGGRASHYWTVDGTHLCLRRTTMRHAELVRVIA